MAQYPRDPQQMPMLFFSKPPSLCQYLLLMAPGLGLALGGFLPSCLWSGVGFSLAGGAHFCFKCLNFSLRMLSHALGHPKATSGPLLVPVCILQLRGCSLPWRSGVPNKEDEQRERQQSLEPLMRTRHALRIPGKCFLKVEFLKIEDGDTFPFVLRIEKEEPQEQSNIFRLVIGRNIQSHKLSIGIRQKKYSWFLGIAGKGEGGTEWHVEGTQPRSMGE